MTTGSSSREPSCETPGPDINFIGISQEHSVVHMWGYEYTEMERVSCGEIAEQRIDVYALLGDLATTYALHLHFDTIPHIGQAMFL